MVDSRRRKCFNSLPVFRRSKITSAQLSRYDGQLSDRNVKAGLVNADFSAEDNILSQMDLRMNRQLLLITHRMNGEKVFRRKRHNLS